VSSPAASGRRNVELETAMRTAALFTGGTG
jgi:hypothetical protein